MKIFICCSKAAYPQVPQIKEALEQAGHSIVLPNSFDNPQLENQMRSLSAEKHKIWKGEMIRLSEEKMSKIDAIVVLNIDKNGIENYIGGATFLEMYEAFRMGKKIYLYNPVPEGILKDEILGFGPKVIHQDLGLVQG